jgi:hypothetical protein
MFEISEKTEYRARRWSLGYCPSCEQEGAVRLEDVVEVSYLWDIIPVWKRHTGEAARCDFCLRHVEYVRDATGIDLADWSPIKGLPLLLKKLGIVDPIALPESTSDVRLHSLLSSVEKRSSATRLQLSPIGLIVGPIVGALLALPLGLWLDDGQPGRFKPGQIVVLLCIAGGFAGIILGPTIEFFLWRDRSVLARITETHEKYRLDLQRLEELAGAYSKRIRKAVKAVRAKAGRRNRGSAQNKDVQEEPSSPAGSG